MNGIIVGLGLPVIGMVLGAACVFFIKDKINPSMNKALLGFVAGVMVAASIWSLLIPAMEMSAPTGFMKIFPSVVSLVLGMGFLLLLDILTPGQHAGEQHSEGPRSNSNDVCGCGRINTGNSIRRPFQFRNHRICNRICDNDDLRLCFIRKK